MDPSNTLTVTPRAMTITPDMLYGGGGKNKLPVGTVGGISLTAIAPATSQSPLNAARAQNAANNRHRWRGQQQQQNHAATSTASSNTTLVSAANTSPSVSIMSNKLSNPASQTDVLQMYNDLLRQQNSYQQAEKLQQALTSGGIRQGIRCTTSETVPLFYLIWLVPSFCQSADRWQRTFSRRSRNSETLF
jgi:hypothetical protein